MHRNKTIGLLLILLAVTASYAQPDNVWSNTFGEIGNDRCWSLKEATNGGFILGGGAQNVDPGFYNAKIIRIDDLGNEQWTRTYGGADDEECYSIQVVPDGYVFAGYTKSFGPNIWDTWLMKIDADGDSVWSRTFANGTFSWCSSLITTADGGFVLAGVAEPGGSSSDNFWLAKTNASGETEWSRTYGGDQIDQCWEVIQTPDGGFLLGGASESYSNGSTDLWILKTDAMGDSLWSRHYGGIHGEVCNDIALTPEGGYLLVGATFSYGEGSFDWWVVKVDAVGDTIWTRTFGSAFEDRCNSVLANPTDGSYILSGYKRQPGMNEDFWIMKLSADGSEEWEQFYGGIGFEQCLASTHTSGSGNVFAGWTRSSGAGAEDFWVIKLGISGHLTLLAPNGGENWPITEGQLITWESVGTEGNFTIQLNRDYPLGAWETIPGLENVPDFGSAEWVVDGPMSRHCRVLISSVDQPEIQDMSDADFSIGRGVYQFQPPSLNFGSVLINTTVMDTFQILSAGDDTLFVDSIRSDNAVFHVDDLQDVLAPGDNVDVVVEFTPDDTVLYEAMITIYTSGGTASVPVSGHGVLTTDAMEHNATTPDDYLLVETYPNPFNAATTIRFSLSQTSHVKIQIHDLIGRFVATLADDEFTAGEHQQSWSCESCASGVYYVVVSTETAQLSRKAVLLR